MKRGVGDAGKDSHAGGLRKNTKGANGGEHSHSTLQKSLADW